MDYCPEKLHPESARKSEKLFILVSMSILMLILSVATSYLAYNFSVFWFYVLPLAIFILFIILWEAKFNKGFDVFSPIYLFSFFISYTF